MRILQYIKYEILDYFSADLYNNKTSSKAQKLQKDDSGGDAKQAKNP